MDQSAFLLRRHLLSESQNTAQARRELFIHVYFASS